MANYDEYQKFLRYKFGSHSFIIITFSTITNYFQHVFYDFQWAENQGLEMMLLVFVAILYSVVRMIYSGAYFSKKQNGLLNALIFALIGIANLYLSFSPRSPLIENGLLTNNIILLVSSIFWLTISITYFVRTLVEKRREKNE